jgi:hypothetical protein
MSSAWSFAVESVKVSTVVNNLAVEIVNQPIECNNSACSVLYCTYCVEKE